MPQRWIIGLASGSSADGVDAALLEVEGVGLEVRVGLVHALHQPYGRELRDMILRVSAPGACDARQVSLLHRLLGETFAAAARQVADRASLSLQRVQCVGCPGHTGHTSLAALSQTVKTKSSVGASGVENSSQLLLLSPVVDICATSS